MKQSDTCSRFLEITYQSCSYQLNDPNAAGSHVVPVAMSSRSNQIILFIFARAIYDAFNAKLQ